MPNPQTPEERKKRRRDRGDDGISWDKVNKSYVGTVSLGYRPDGKRDRRTVRGRTKAQVKDRLETLHERSRQACARPPPTPSSSA